MSEIKVDLYDRDTNTETPVWVEYGTVNAEPRAGIMSPYGYVKNVSMWIPAFGSILIHLDDFFAQIVREAVEDQIWEDEYNPVDTSLERDLTALENEHHERSNGIY